MHQRLLLLLLAPQKQLRLARANDLAGQEETPTTTTANVAARAPRAVTRVFLLLRKRSDAGRSGSHTRWRWDVAFAAAAQSFGEDADDHEEEEQDEGDGEGDEDDEAEGEVVCYIARKRERLAKCLRERAAGDVKDMEEKTKKGELNTYNSSSTGSAGWRQMPPAVSPHSRLLAR